MPWNRFLSRDEKKTDLKMMGVFVQSLWYIHNEFLWGDMTNGLSCGFCANVLDVKYLTELRCWPRRWATGLMTHGWITERGTLWNDFKVSLFFKASRSVLHSYLLHFMVDMQNSYCFLSKSESCGPIIKKSIHLRVAWLPFNPIIPPVFISFFPYFSISIGEGSSLP